mmetsp:Transcript_9968/g.29482  ORF Transcript_9968/g.29482 Transcript_9968/m.29482 type:complete len:247 (-) Transcript_9968:124-864(-)
MSDGSSPPGLVGGASSSTTPPVRSSSRPFLLVSEEERAHDMSCLRTSTSATPESSRVISTSSSRYVTKSVRVLASGPGSSWRRPSTSASMTSSFKRVSLTGVRLLKNLSGCTPASGSVTLTSVEARGCPASGDRMVTEISPSVMPRGAGSLLNSWSSVPGAYAVEYSASASSRVGESTRPWPSCPGSWIVQTPLRRLLPAGCGVGEERSRSRMISFTWARVLSSSAVVAAPAVSESRSSLSATIAG